MKELDFIKSFKDSNLIMKLRFYIICLEMIKIFGEYLEEIKKYKKREQFLQEKFTIRIKGKEYKFSHVCSKIVKFRDNICVPKK